MTTKDQPLKLYYTPGACSLSPHIALREAGLPFELVQVNLAEKKLKDGGDYLAVNPKGYVPALTLADGELLTEGALIVQYVADLKPEAKLAPKLGTPSRRRLQEWLHFIATELHKAFGPINNPKTNPELKQVLLDRLKLRFQFLATSLQGKSYLVDDVFTVADGYAFYTLRGYQKLVGPSFGDSQVLSAYFARLSARPAVQEALKAEGLA
jgi:glutathione S-transferase